VNYRKLGKTGLQVSEIGFGGIPLQRVNLDEAVTVVQEALKLGINFFDSARGYTDSEEKIGRALQGVPRSEVLLATKSGVHTKEEMKRDIEISLRNFRTDYLDLYQLHNCAVKRRLRRSSVPEAPGRGSKRPKKRAGFVLWASPAIFLLCYWSC